VIEAMAGLADPPRLRSRPAALHSEYEMASSNPQPTWFAPTPRCIASLLDRAAGAASTASMLALILGGGHGRRLGGLTRHCAKPAVAFAGGLRLIDFSLFNCLESGIADVAVLTQHLAETLIPYVENDWGRFASRHGMTVGTLPHTRGEIGRYNGTADAVYRNLDFICDKAPSHVLILGGDHVYRMDYGDILAAHVARGAQVTVGCIESPVADARAFGVMQIDRSRRVLSFEEKPDAPRTIPGRPSVALASMGIYVFDTDFLIDVLCRDAVDSASGHDFGSDIIPAAVRRARVYAHEFQDAADPGQPGYWRDVGTVDAYWRCNLDLLDRPVETGSQASAIRVPGRPATAPCVAPGASVLHSVVSVGVCIGDRCDIEDSVLLPGAVVGPGCRIRNAVIADGCHIPGDTLIGLLPASDRLRYEVSPGGIVLVTAQMLERDAVAA
jgi:glucose-1-phosphate adenylyltransferase